MVVAVAKEIRDVEELFANTATTVPMVTPVVEVDGMPISLP